MPITITIPNREFFDQVNNRFFTIKGRNLTFEHSLLSITKWESRWHKPYLSKAEKTKEEAIDYLRCMCLDKDVDPKIFMAIDVQSMKEITSYIENPMTATTFRDDNKKPNREIGICGAAPVGAGSPGPHAAAQDDVTAGRGTRPLRSVCRIPTNPDLLIT